MTAWAIKQGGSALLLLLLTAPRVLFAAEDQLTLLDGQQFTATISQISTSGEIQGKGVPPGLRLDGVSRIDRAAAPNLPPAERTAKATVMIELAGGGRLQARDITIRDEQCHVVWQFGADLVFPIDALRAIRFQPNATQPSFEQALAKPSADFDRLFVTVADGVQAVNGLTEELSAEQVVFQWEGKRQRLYRGELYGIVMAQAGGGSTNAAICSLDLHDGSSLRGAIDSLASNVLKLRLSPAAKIDVPWSAVSAVRIQSDRLVYLSDLEPIEAIQEPIVTFEWPWQRDRSVMGRKLTIGNQTFEKGLGTHAECRLTFYTGANYDLLLATIGIDAETGGKGDCQFVVLGEGKRLFSQRVRGSDPPRDLRLNITGVNNITLLVEAGEDLDLADHGNWCNARLIRTSK